ncbi:hypothetical protein TcWFU_002970 [Taenia crassiceps]|uniref:VHS domain-containing protein n=1 Tax=Taenia crassiceps TaxID=6207 RepID=A0ABR4Q9S4_9CEST
MARYKDIFNAIEYATNEGCPNRLLAFAKVRSIALGGAAAAQSTARQIVNRFCNVASESQRISLWSLDLLQMCALHGGDAFALALNGQDRINDLLAFLLNPTKTKSVSGQIQQKLLSLIQTWAITYKNTFSSSNFGYACDRLKKSGVELNAGGLRNLHWLPNKDVLGNLIESATYNLQEVVSEMSTENRQLHAELQNIFKMASEQRPTNVNEDIEFKKRLFEASRRTLEIQKALYASQAFWNDIIEHLEATPEDLKEIKSNVQCIFESMEQSIACCITALKADPSVRTAEAEPENKGQTEDHKSETKTRVKSSGFWSCALCNLRFDDKNRLLNHIKAPDHQRQLENRLCHKAKSPVSSPQDPVKEKSSQAVRRNSTLGKKERSIFKPYIEVQPKPPIVYSEPYVPLSLDKSPTTPSPTAPETIYMPHISVRQMPKGRRFDDSGYIRTSTRSNITTERIVPQPEIAKQMLASNAKVPEVKALMSKQTQTEMRESAGSVVVSASVKSRPINVQCNDCQISFSDLDKLLSHPCRIAVPSTVSETDPPLFFSSPCPPTPSVQVASQSTANGTTSFFCQECGLDFDEKHLFKAHLLTPRHKFSVGRRGAVNRNVPIAPPNLLLEQTEKASALTFGNISSSISKISHENANHATRVGHPFEHFQQSQSSLMHVKAVETIGAQWHRSVERPTTRAVEGPDRQIPDHPIQSGIAARLQEISVASENGALQEINSLIQKHNIVARGDSFFCKTCFVYLHYEELNEHINCVDHQRNIAISQVTTAPFPSQKVNESAKPIVRMPSLPSLYSAHPALPDANYIAVYVPAEQAIEVENRRRPIFTQYVSLGSPKFPLFNAATEAKGGPLERNAMVRRLL